MEIKTNVNFEELYKDSYYTITGAGGDINEWIKGITDILEKEEIGTPAFFVTFTGKQMNDHYQLDGDVAYPDDLTFLAFPLDNLVVPKLAMFKLVQEDRWFDDIVDNNKRHQRNQ